VLLLQGRAEFIEKAFEVVGELRSRGLDVFTFDWRGQGGSDRALADARRGHVRHFSDFRHDLMAAQEAMEGRGLGPGPVHVLAHSMGGCIALTGAAEGWLKADSLVALAPMIGLSLVRRTALARGLSGVLNLAGLGELSVPGGRVMSISSLPFAGNPLCSDRRRYERNAAVAAALGSGAIGSPTIGWVAAAFDAMGRLSEPGLAEAIRIPVLLAAAGADPICSTPAVEAFARRLPNGRYLLVPGALHEILHESDPIRELFWRAFDDFLAGGLPSRTAAPGPAVALSP
jgi:lysophospholipase